MMCKAYESKGFTAIPAVILICLLCVIIAGSLVGFKIGSFTLSMDDMLQNPSLYEKKWSKHLKQSESVIQNSFLNPKDSRLQSIPLYEKIIPEGAKLIAVHSNGKNQSDVVTVNIQGNKQSTKLNCQGIPIHEKESEQFKVFVNDNHQLVCQSVHSSDTHVMVENVEAMHVSLGIDLNADNKVDRLFSPKNLQVDLSQVLSMRMSLLLKTQTIHENILDKKFYTLENQEIGPFEDNRLRKIYTFSIRLS